MAGKSKFINYERGTKRCACCHAWFPFDSFPLAHSRAKTGRHGRQAYCRACNVVKSREWAVANKKRRKAINDAHNKRMRDSGRYKRRELTPEQRARKNEHQRAYSVANMDKVLMWNKLRLHKKRGGGPMPNRYEIGAMLCEQEWLCPYCLKILDDTYHIEHKTPVSRGGTNNPDNLQFVCRKCNLTKQRKTHEEYLQTIGRLI